MHTQKRIVLRSVCFLLFTLTLSSAFAPVSAKPMKTKPMSSRNPISVSPSSSAATSTRDFATKLHLAPVIFNNAPFVQSSLIFAGLNGLGWVISLLTKSHLHLDLIGTGAFAVAGIMPLLAGGVFDRVTLSAGMMTLWGTKLAGFLFFRALQTGHDGRLDDMLSTVSGTSESI
jgi:hypothetical protein